MQDPRLFPAVILFAALALPGAAAAQSACLPAAPGDGDSVVCNGTGTGIVDDGLDDATILVEAGAVISGADQGFEFDDDVTFTNHGTITGLGDHGVQGDNGVSILNTGTITGDGDGVNIDNDGQLINEGTIIGADDGVQLEENASVVNRASGVIRGADEGVNINTDNASLINYGTIEAGDDGVNAARNATIVNYGLITSTGGAQDGVDLDSGEVVNHGTILAVGVEDGIDFDPSPDASRVENTGRIEGNIAINTDPADTGAQTVVNSGALIGRGGTALDLGAGDDALVLLRGWRVEGLVEMGDGTDSVTVAAVQAGTLRFGSLPEVLSFAGPGLQSATTLYLLDPVPLAAPALLVREAGFGATSVALARAEGRGDGADSWAAVFGGDGAVAASGALQGIDTRSGGVIAGRRFGAQTGFVSLVRGRAETADGHRLSQTALLAGVVRALPLEGATALAYLGLTDTTLRSAAGLSGDAGIDGALVGAALRFHAGFGGSGAQPALDLTLQADVLHHRSGAYALAGLGGGRVAAQGATAYGLHVDLGMPLAVGAGVLRPSLFADLRGGDAGTMRFALGGADTRFAAADLLSANRYGLGVSYTAGGFEAGLAWARGEGDTDALAARVAFRLAF